MVKRKAASTLTTKTRPEKAPRTTGLTEIDSEGNLQLQLTGDSPDEPNGLVVDRAVLCQSSPVFKAMLGTGSRFIEGKNAGVRDGRYGDIQIIRVGDDDARAMTTAMYIVHLKGFQVPTEVTFEELYQLAVLCDKYDMRAALGPWPDIWARKFLPFLFMTRMERWLFVAWVFQFKDLLPQIVGHWIMSSKVDAGSGLLVAPSGVSFTEGVPDSLVDAIVSVRSRLINRLQGHLSDIIQAWRPNSEPRSGVFGCGGPVTDSDYCIALNFGFLSQTFPLDITNPLPTVKFTANISIKQVLNLITRLPHREESDALTEHFKANHGGCDVAPIVIQAADYFCDKICEEVFQDSPLTRFVRNSGMEWNLRGFTKAPEIDKSQLPPGATRGRCSQWT